MEQSLTPGISRATRRTSRNRSGARRHLRAADAAVDQFTVQEAVAILESAAVALAAEHVTAADLAEVRFLNRQMAVDLDRQEYDRAVTSANEFHEVFHRQCPNRHLLALLHRESSSLVRCGPIRTACLRETVVEDHERLVDLIESGAESRVIERHVRAHCGTGDLCMVHHRAAIG